MFFKFTLKTSILLVECLFWKSLPFFSKKNTIFTCEFVCKQKEKYFWHVSTCKTLIWKKWNISEGQGGKCKYFSRLVFTDIFCY